MRDGGWTCEYHEPVDDFGECSQCDDSHRKTADAVIEALGLREVNLGRGIRQYVTDVWNATDV